MNTFVGKTVLGRSRAGTWWRYCLGLVAAVFILSATDCSAEAVIGDQPKPRTPACYGMNRLNKTTIPPEEPVALAGTYVKNSNGFATTLVFTDGNIEFTFGQGTGFEKNYTGRYQYTERGRGQWPFIFLNGSLRREGDFDVSKVQVYNLEYDSCHSETVGRPTALAWLADGRILVGTNDAPLRPTHYYSSNIVLITFAGNTPPPLSASPLKHQNVTPSPACYPRQYPYQTQYAI